MWQLPAVHSQYQTVQFHTNTVLSGNDNQWKYQVGKNQLPCIISGGVLVHYIGGDQGT